MCLRSEIVAAARVYLGRPFRHQGRLTAFDCVGLVLAVAEKLGLADVDGRPIRGSDYGNYGPQGVDAFVHQECGRRLIELTAGFLQPGAVLTLRVPTIACHTAIVATLGGNPSIIHAYAGAEKVVEHRLDRAWLGRIAGVFDFPGVTDG